MLDTIKGSIQLYVLSQNKKIVLSIFLEYVYFQIGGSSIPFDRDESEYPG